MMALEGFHVKRVDRKSITKFIEENHYSKSINGCIADYCFALFDRESHMVGAMFFGRMAMAGQWKKYGSAECDVIELRRLCCVDDTPRNAESFFIGKAIRLMKKLWKGKTIVSYADAEHGHSGVIYKATNFEYRGLTKGARVIIFDGKKYHDKTIRTKYNGKLKPFAEKIKRALDSGEAFYKETAGKHVFVLNIKKSTKHQGGAE